MCTIGLRSDDFGGYLSYSELIVMYKKPVWDDLSVVIWYVIRLDLAIKRWTLCGHKGTEMVSNNTKVHCCVLAIFIWYSGVKYEPKKNIPHHYTTTSSLNCWYMAGWILAFKFWPYRLTVEAEIHSTYQTWQRCPSSIVTFPSRVNMLCIQMSFSCLGCNK